MPLSWRIRYLDSGDRPVKDRDLCLESGKLDAATRAANAADAFAKAEAT